MTKCKESPSIVVAMTLEEMPDDHVIKAFLLQNRAEVTSMCITEYDEAKNNELLRAEGKAEGKAEERYKLLGNLIRKGLLSEKQAAEEANVSVAEFRKLAAQFA